VESVIVIAGPTASGKTRISIQLAKEINGEIVSADSMQVYKYMDIGTAKPDSEEMSGIKHYLISEVYPDEEFSVARYRELALKYISEILEKGKKPIVVGGTGLYINSLIYNINFSETVSDWELRKRLEKEAEEKGNKHIHNILKQIDPHAASKIHENDLKRIIRAIEVYTHTGRPITFHQEMSRHAPPKYNFVIIGLNMDRQVLYDRIDRRVDKMLEKGLIDEVRELKRLGYGMKTIPMQGLGYKEMLAYLRGELTYQEAVNLLKRGTRRYAKRQLTWFRRIENLMWVNVDKFKDDSEIIKNIKYLIATSGIFL
jgi:tRNA dimethylallyltransferase